jgi:hypothetical protein
MTVIAEAAHVRLCHSRMMFVRVYPGETQESRFPARGLRLGEAEVENEVSLLRECFLTPRLRFKRLDGLSA